MAKQTWKIGESREADDGGSGVVRMTPNSDDDGPTSVGKLLRARREEAEQDLRYVSQMLRIRYPYLEAIEDGRVDDLPGATYAVGFVRAYAEHLGLDAPDIISRFKEDTKGLEDQPRLVFPAPLPEGKIPSGAILLVAVILALVVYGGWIQLSSQNQSIADFIPQLPDRLAALIGLGDAEPEAAPKSSAGDVDETATKTASEPSAARDKETTATAAPAETKPETPAGSVESAPVAESGGIAEKEKPATPTETETAAESAPASAGSPPATAEKPASETPAATVAATAETTAETTARDIPATPAATAETTAETPARDIPATAAATSETVSETPSTATPAPPETTDAGIQAVGAEFPPIHSEPASEQVASAPSEQTRGVAVAVPPDPPTDEPRPPRIYGLENTGARIVIRAITDSWVEIRDGSGELLLTRVLRVGDTYRVPDRSGLSLVTGNAGGLEFIVDNEAVPALGPVGSVRRNVSLDPALLTAGQAYIQ